jgi:hypothetical protein
VAEGKIIVFMGGTEADNGFYDKSSNFAGSVLIAE